MYHLFVKEISLFHNKLKKIRHTYIHTYIQFALTAASQKAPPYCVQKNYNFLISSAGLPQYLIKTRLSKCVLLFEFPPSALVSHGFIPCWWRNHVKTSQTSHRQSLSQAPNGHSGSQPDTGDHFAKENTQFQNTHTILLFI